MGNKLASMLAAAALLLVAGAASGESFPAAAIDGDAATPTISGVLFKPTGAGPFPAVVMLHSCGGVQPHLDAGWPSFFTGLGYVLLAVDTFGSRGAGRCPNKLWFQANLFLKDAYGALEYLAAQPFVDAKRIAVIGFSVGADHINNALVPLQLRKPGQLDFRAAIAFYGRCEAIGPYPETSIPLMEVVAQNDTRPGGYSRGCVDQATMSPRIEVHVLADAYHAFDVPGARGQKDAAGNVMFYSAPAVRASRQHTKDFLEKRFGSP